MQQWKTKLICAGKYRPRQFEYHPLHEDVLVFGTVRGEAVVVDLSTNSVCSSISSGLSKDRRDSILGLCWLKQRPNHFVVGSSNGCLRLCESGLIPSTSTRERLAAGAVSGGDGVVQRRYEELKDNCNALDVPVGKGPTIVKEFERFERLTSVHVNSTDDHMLVSGYTSGVSLFDISTGSVVRQFQDIHEDHINISRFANHSPFVFATSSFDCTVKAWDSRMPSGKTPIYTCKSDMGHVMLSFSPDDMFLLTSAVDNEVKQYLAVDGSLHLNLDLPRTGLDENFTRSYYTSSGRMILSGSSEEQMVRLYCSQTGRMVHETEMYPGRKHGSLYVQSLRGDPHHDHRFSVLVNYRDPSYPLEIINVDMLKGNNGEELRSPMTYASSARLSSDLGRACLVKAGADMYLVARNRLRFAAHKAIVSCRCRVLGALIDKAVATRDDDGGVELDVNQSLRVRSAGASEETAAVVEQQRHPRLTIDHENDDVLEDCEMVPVCLPRAVAPEIVPVVLEYLYTDRLKLEATNEDSGHAKAYSDPGIGETRRHSGRSKWHCESTARTGASTIKRDSGRDMPSEVIILEKLLEAAEALGLERLSCLVEWQCSRLVDTMRVVALAKMALRLKREQLLQFCVHFLVSHLGAVYVLHGIDCLSLDLQTRVNGERGRRQYALNRAPENSVMSLRLTRNASVMHHTHQQAAAGATGATPTGLVGQADNGSNAGHSGNALGAALAAAAAAVSAALGNVQAVGGGQGAGGAAPAMGGAAAQAPGQVGAVLSHVANGFEANDHDDHGDDNDEGVMEDEEDVDDLEDGNDDTGDEDDIVDEEVESTNMSGDDSGGEDDEGPWIDPSQCGENLSADVRRRLVPSSYGHSGTAVFGSHMAVIGGSNRRQVHSCRHVLMYNPLERSWSKMPTRGNAPSGLVHHSCTVLEPSWAVQRNLVIIGGPRQVPRRTRAPVAVLDCLTMEWSRPIISGEHLADRTRHTAVALCSDEDMPNRVPNRGSGGKIPDGRFRHPSADDEDFAASRRGKQDHVKTAGVGRTQDDGGETNVIIFGGYAPAQNGAVFNDVVMLNVTRLPPGMSANAVAAKRDRTSRHGLGHGRSEQQAWADPDGSSDSEDENGSCYVDRESCLEDDDCGGMHVCTRSNHAYRYRWVWPMVLGTPPTARLAHAAAVVRVSERREYRIHGSGGREANKGTRNVAYMVVFGGVGEDDVFNDVGVLKCTAGMEWIMVQVNGRRPARRFGHSMVALTSGSSENYAKLAVFGGTSGRYVFNDLFLLTINPGTGVNGVPRVKAEWEHLARRTLGVMPSPRSRQSMCLINGELIIFGGSDQTSGINNMEPLHREGDSLVYHVRPRIIGRSLPRSLSSHEATAASHLTATGDSIAFRHGGGSGGSGSSSGASSVPRRQVHERAMAREVASRMSLVQAAETKKTTAAVFQERASIIRSNPGSSSNLLQQLHGIGARGQGVANAAREDGDETQLTGAEADVLVPQSPLGSFGGVIAGNPPAFSGHASRFSWQVASPFGDTSVVSSGRRTHEPHLLKHPPPSEWNGGRSRSSVHILWESIRPQVFVYDAGPQPPVMAPPAALHKEMESLIGSTKFSDVQFRFQAIDYTLPTTPTNTAHYAIVPPLTSPSISPKDTTCPSSPFSFSLHDQQPLAHHHDHDHHDIDIATSAATGAVGASSTTSVRSGPRPRTSTVPSVLPIEDSTAFEGPQGSNLVSRDRRSVVRGASSVGGSEGSSANGTRAHRGGVVLPKSQDSVSLSYYRHRDVNRRICRPNANGSDGTVVDPDELARQSRSSSAAAPSPSSQLTDLFASSTFGASRGEEDGLVCNRGSSSAHAPSGVGWTSPTGNGLRYTAGAFGRAPSTSEGELGGSVEKIWRWGDSEVDVASAVAGSAEVEEKCKEHFSGVVRNKSVGTRSSAAKEPARGISPRTTARPVSPSSSWVVIPQLADSPSSAMAYSRSACSASGGSRRFFSPLEADADAVENHAAPRDCIRGVDEGGQLAGELRKGGGVSANGGSGTERVHAHRVVVSLRSDPIRAMLRSGMRETFSTEALVKDIRPTVFSALLTYLYTDSLQLERPQDIIELLVVANQYTLGDLVCLCEGFLQGVLDEDNASHLYHYADALGMPTFERRVLAFILRRWGRVTRTEGWLALPEELRVRANNFRTRETHIFMLGQKDHVAWKGDWKMAEWVYEKARILAVPTSPEEKAWCEEVMRVRNKMATARLMTEERRSVRSMTAGESEGATS